jgi:hypothetical protein
MARDSEVALALYVIIVALVFVTHSMFLGRLEAIFFSLIILFVSFLILIAVEKAIQDMDDFDTFDTRNRSARKNHWVLKRIN